MAARAPMATLTGMETETEAVAVSERCRQSWAAYEAASREAGERAKSSWLSIEREGAGMAERSSASWGAMQAAAR
jgi:hypothetical protein